MIPHLRWMVFVALAGLCIITNACAPQAAYEPQAVNYEQITMDQAYQSVSQSAKTATLVIGEQGSKAAVPIGGLTQSPGPSPGIFLLRRHESTGYTVPLQTSRRFFGAKTLGVYQWSEFVRLARLQGDDYSKVAMPDSDYCVFLLTKHPDDVFGFYFSFGPVVTCWTNQNDANSFADSFARLSQGSDEELAAAVRHASEKNASDEKLFESQAAAYRAANPKPAVPEQARAYALQANDAFNNHREDDAVELYQKAIQLAPWNPPFHYNLATLLADEQHFEEAVSEMRKYLVLVPDAPNAREARDKIYVWQGRSGSEPARAQEQ